MGGFNDVTTCTAILAAGRANLFTKGHVEATLQCGNRLNLSGQPQPVIQLEKCLPLRGL